MQVALQHPAIAPRTRRALLRVWTSGRESRSQMSSEPVLELKRYTSGSDGEAAHPSTRTRGFRPIGTILTAVLRSMGLK